jgi:hypothetical protein
MATMINFKEYLEEGKNGLWDNIHAKRKRIKNGSGEKMRKPGSKGAPSAADFKAANEEVQIDEIVVALAPIDVRNPKKPEPTKVRYQGDIVPPTQPPSTEKRGVKGRPGQRPMPTYEELSADEQFDLIEEVVEELAEEQGIDSEAIWETLESIEDNELLEYAIDKKGYKSSTGGLTQKGVDAYNRKTGGNLQTAVTTPPSKLKPGSKAANRRKSFCARMGGMPGAMKDDKGRPTRKALALRKWNC